MASRLKVEQTRGLDLNAGEQDEESSDAHEELASDPGGNGCDSGERLVSSGGSDPTPRKVSFADTEVLEVSDVSGWAAVLPAVASSSGTREISQSLQLHEETQKGVDNAGRTSCLVDGCKDSPKPLCEVVEIGNTTVADAKTTVAEENQTVPDKVKPAEFVNSSHECESFDKFESSVEKLTPEVTFLSANLAISETSMTKNEASENYMVAADKSGAQRDVRMNIVVSTNVRETAETMDASNLKEVKGIKADKTNTNVSSVGGKEDNSLTNDDTLAVVVGEKSMDTSGRMTIQAEVSEIHNQTELQLDGQRQPGDCAGASIFCRTEKRSCHEKPQDVFVDAGCSGRESSANLSGMEPENLEGLADQMDVQVAVMKFADRNEPAGETMSCQENALNEKCAMVAALIHQSTEHLLDTNNMVTTGHNVVIDAQDVKTDSADSQLFGDDRSDKEHILLAELPLVERVANAEMKTDDGKLGSCNSKHKEHDVRVHDVSISNPLATMSESNIAKLDDNKNEKTDIALSSPGLILDKCSCDGEFFMDGLNLTVEINTNRSSELSQVENVVMQDGSPTIEYCQNAEIDKFSEADQMIVMPGENIENGDYVVNTNDNQNMMVDEQDQGACYYFSSKDDGGFSTSDLVWGKVKSHPWWPGQIFDASDASDLALKYRKKDNFLVAYFGDRTFAWCDESQLKHFEMYFSEMEKQTNSEVFVDAVSGALDEVSRRIAVGMTCFCSLETACPGISYQKVENAGIREGSNGYVIDRCSSLSYFEPSRLLDYVKTLAKFPDGGTDRLALLIANVQLKAFYRSKGYPELPSFLTDGEISDSDGEVPQSNSESTDEVEQSSTFSDLISRKKKSRGFNKQSNVLEDGRKRKSLSELMEAEDSQFVNGVKKSGIIYDFESTFSSRKKYKFNDSDSSDSGKGKKKRLDSLGDMEVKLPSTTMTSSFKVGECIRRVASQLTGSSSNLKITNETSSKKVFKDDSIFDVFVSDGFSHNVMQSPTFELENWEDCPSADEVLSLLHLIATDPFQGYSYLSTISSFLNQFRNCCISTSTSEKRHPEKSWGKREKKRKVEPQPAVSGMTEPDHMQDSYWSDLITHNTPAKIKIETHTRSQRKRRKSSGQTSSLTLVPVMQGPEHLQAGISSSNMKQALATDRPIISVEEKMVDECTPTALILTFNGSKTIPSETDLIRIFGRYGPLKETSTEVQSGNKRVKVVFKRRADAEIAFSSAGKYSIFGPSLLSYRLRYLQSALDSSPDTMHLEKNSTLPEENSSLEVPGYLNSFIFGVSADTNPQDAPNCHLSMPNTSLDANLQEKIDVVLTENSHPDITSDLHSSVSGASTDTNLQNQSDAAVLSDNIHMEIPVDLEPSELDASTDTDPLNKSDKVLAENNNIDIPNCLYPSASNASLDTNLQNQGDAVLIESSITNIPDDLHPPVSDACPDAGFHEKNVGVSNISHCDVVDNKITNVHSPHHSPICDASLETNIQNQSSAVPIENSTASIQSDFHPTMSDTFPDSSLHEKNDTVSDIGNSDMVLTESSIANINSELHCSTSDVLLVNLRNGSDAVAEDGSKTDLPCNLYPSMCNASPETNIQCKSDTVFTESSKTSIPGDVYVSTLDASEDFKKLDKNDIALAETSNMECSVQAAEEDAILDTLQVVSEVVVAEAEVEKKAG